VVTLLTSVAIGFWVNVAVASPERASVAAAKDALVMRTGPSATASKPALLLAASARR